ncbi:MAG TPA: HAD hydrolase-like protein [Verrucomicrobiae bacterium]|nr:HAD hydrolase-like protein [Verrucomicrobiae bacterium]
MTIYLDLDGPILDVSQRYWKVHCDIVLQHAGLGIGKDIYWEMKRDRMPVSTILSRTGNEHIPQSTYQALWLERVERPDYLEFDSIIHGAKEQLSRLRDCHPLVLVTLRQKPELLHQQIDRLDLRRFFSGILSASPIGDGADTKRRLIQTNRFKYAGGVIVGDTEVDIGAGKALGLSTIAVLSGIRNRKQLMNEKPDHIAVDINAASDIIRAMRPGRESVKSSEDREA